MKKKEQMKHKLSTKKKIKKSNSIKDKTKRWGGGNITNQKLLLLSSIKLINFLKNWFKEKKKREYHYRLYRHSKDSKRILK